MLPSISNMAVRNLSAEVLIDSSHSQTLLCSLNEQRTQGVFSDVTIIVEDKKFKAHKNVLAASCLYFKNALSSDNVWFSGRVLELSDFKAELFREILDFIYTAKVTVKGTEKVRDLVAAGKRLGIPFLENLTDLIYKDTLSLPPSSCYSNSIQALPPEKSAISISPHNLKLEANVMSERRGEDSVFLNGPRITNAFSIVETEASANLFSPLDLTATAKKALATNSISNIYSKNIAAPEAEKTYTFADHSYAVSSTSATQTAKSSECCEILLHDVNGGNEAALARVPNTEAAKQTCTVSEKLFAQNSSACLAVARAPASTGVNKQMNLDLVGGTFFRPNPPIKIDTDTVNNTVPIEDETKSGYSSNCLTPAAPGSSTFSCDHCLKSFSNIDLLNAHIQLHKKYENARACRFCNKRFVRLKKLEIHEQFCKRSVTFASAQKSTFGQEQSSSDFGTEDGKNNTPSISLPFSEGRCNSYTDKFLGPSRNESSPHEDHLVKVVDGKVLYICSVCKRTYVTQSSLRRHANVHSWRREYPCHYCNKVFALAEYRTKHEIWHTGERRYQCIFCLETFMTYYILKNHQKSFHGIDPRLTVNKKTANGGFKPNIYPYKLYRLLPMKFRRRSFKECSKPLSENAEECGQHDELSSDVCSIPNLLNSISSFDCPVNTHPSEISTNISLEQPSCTESESLRNVQSDITFGAGVSGGHSSDDHQSHMSSNENRIPSVGTESDMALPSSNPPTISTNDVSCSIPSVISYGYSAPSVIMHSSRISSVIMHGNAVCSVKNNNTAEKSSNTFNQLLPQEDKSVIERDCIKEQEKQFQFVTRETPEKCRAADESGQSSDLFPDVYYSGHKTETYIAKPALPDTSENREVAPLCHITVRIGNEAIVRRQISGSTLYKKRRKSKHSNSVEEMPGQHTQTEESKGGTTDAFVETDLIKGSEPYEDTSDHDSTDKPWRPYYTYKPRKKPKGLKKKKWKKKRGRNNSTKHTNAHDCWQEPQKLPEKEVVDSEINGSSDRVDSSFSDKATFTTEEIKKHLKQDSITRPYCCELCQKDFQSLSTLKLHMRCHTGEQPYVCKTCGRRFSIQGNLQKHERIHLGVKEYVCQYCNKAFTLNETLKKHERIHTGEKRYCCNVCSQRFLYLSTKKNHEQKHLRKKGKKFFCSQCSKVCKTAAALAMHQKMHLVRSLSQGTGEHESDKNTNAVQDSHLSKPHESNICDPDVAKSLFTPASNTQENFELSEREVKVEDHPAHQSTAASKGDVCMSPKKEERRSSSFVCNDTLKQVPQQSNWDSCQTCQYDLKGAETSYPGISCKQEIAYPVISCKQESTYPVISCKQESAYPVISCKQEITNYRKKESSTFSPPDCYYQPVTESVCEENFPCKIQQPPSPCYEIVQFHRTLMCKYPYGDATKDTLLQDRTFISSTEANSC